MDRINELEQSQQIEFAPEFYECLNAGIFFTAPKLSTDKIYTGKMSANVVIHHWNHSNFLAMLFQSFDNLDKKDIDVEFIITDSGSNDKEVDNIKKILEIYKGNLKITFLYHVLDDYRKTFNEKNLDGTFHGFPYISNSALNYCNKDIHLLCDSSNIVNKEWLRSLCSPHYLWKNNLIIKSKGADFTAKSTLFLEDKIFDESYFKLEHKYYEFTAGTGFGWSIKTINLKELGGFRHLLSCCGAVDDCLFYRANFEKYLILGHKNAFAIHRLHKSGYEENKREPNWGYKKLKELYVDKKIISGKIDREYIEPKNIIKNF